MPTLGPGTQIPRRSATRPITNLFTPPIPAPTTDVNNLRACVQALKEGVESLIGQRGDANNRAVTFNDMISFGLLTSQAVGSPSGGATTGVTAITIGAGLSGTPNPITETGTIVLTVPVSVANGGTGATTAATALTSLGAAPLASPVFTGDARAVTPLTADNDTSIATTAYVQAQGYATTAAMIAADALKAPLASPVFTGDPRAPTPLTADNDTSIATTAYVQAQGYATSAAMTTADNLRVLKAGDTMTGGLGIGIAPPGGAGAWLRVMNQTVGTGYTEITRFGVANNAGATNYSELGIFQNGLNTMALEARDQANTKGTLQLQPYGGAVVTGGSITTPGPLTISSPAGYAQLVFSASAGNANHFLGERSGSLRWEMQLGGAAAETGGNVGTDFYINRFSDTGAFLGTPMAITRANGNAEFSGNLMVGGGVFTGAGGNTMQLASGNALFNVNVVANDNTKQCGFPGAAWSGVTSYVYTTSSSAALKTGVEPVPAGALDQILRLSPKTYRWKDGPETARTHHGFIAEEVRDVFGPDFGGYVDGDGSPGIAYNELTAVLWQAVRELAVQVAELAAL